MGTIEVMVGRRAKPIVTARLVLEPVTQELARAVVTGRVSDLPEGAGWPHADTADAMAMALSADAGPSWVVTVGGTLIGDCGAFSWPDDRGVVEIGYGLAEPYRNKGYATEAVGAMCRWLFAEAGATVITATATETDNVPSRRVLEKLGFAPVENDGLHVSYRLERASTGRPDGSEPTGDRSTAGGELEARRGRRYRTSTAAAPWGSQACQS